MYVEREAAGRLNLGADSAVARPGIPRICRRDRTHPAFRAVATVDLARKAANP